MPVVLETLILRLLELITLDLLGCGFVGERKARAGKARVRFEHHYGTPLSFKILKNPSRGM